MVPSRDFTRVQALLFSLTEQQKGREKQPETRWEKESTTCDHVLIQSKFCLGTSKGHIDENSRTKLFPFMLQ
ncbi:unnamed protein product [Lasius platythorax]|uniref:Uncharacterized protein n=1 Tax=Lasius platythorax TaxID=488582 RepID=A0AAV2NQ65_9HYME